MKVITMDCRGCVPRSNLHRVFADALAFPDYYGNNLNALYDCLTEIGEDTQIQLLYWQAVEEKLGHYAQNARRAMEDAAEKNPHLEIRFL
jgi:ribonuclease inhibitor